MDKSSKSAKEVQREIEWLELENKRLDLAEQLERKRERIQPPSAGPEAVATQKRRFLGDYGLFIKNFFFAVVTNVFSNGLQLAIWVSILALFAFMALTAYEKWRDVSSDKQESVPAIELIQQVPTLSPDVATALPPEVAQQLEQTWQRAEQARVDAEQALRDVDRTDGNLNQLLSMLQGVSVLVGLALGAAAFFGFQNAKESREDLERIRKKADDELSNIEQHQPDLERLGEIGGLYSDLNALNVPDQIKNILAMQESFFTLLQAEHELRLRNYSQAYHFIQQVLDAFPENPNPLALYFTGWLELQYIPGKLEEGVEKLRRARTLADDWPSAIAAYGVAVRRLARNEPDKDKQNRLFTQALGLLLEALDQAPSLLDLNQESLWGPVAGIWRDMMERDKAIDAYEKACKITSNSSYPYGNLAALYWYKAKHDHQPELLTKAVDMFKLTRRYAHSELLFTPADYFTMMDVSMSATVLSGVDASPVDMIAEAERYLDNALATNPSPEMLGVSWRGWQFLLEGCPDDSDWGDVRQRLGHALDRVSR